jgi:hypothetical protein
MSDMVERGARALCVAEGVDPDRPAFGGHPEWMNRAEKARAALLAALDVTDDEVKAIGADLDPKGDPVCEVIAALIKRTTGRNR